MEFEQLALLSVMISVYFMQIFLPLIFTNIRQKLYIIQFTRYTRERYNWN